MHPFDRSKYRGGRFIAATFATVALFGAAPPAAHAGGFLTIFQPKHFTAVPVSQADARSFRLLPQAERFGTQRVLRREHRLNVASLEQARAHVDFAVRTPSKIPAEVGNSRSFSVETASVFAYTFSAAKARAYAAKTHKRLPAMPANLDGTTVVVSIGPIVEANYGAQRGTRDAMALRFVQMRAPSVTSTGASLRVLEKYLLSMPNVSPQFAAQIRALGDLQQTLPIPIVVSKQSAKPVEVDGVQGLGIGDNTGVGAGVMWQKNGVVYGLYGPFAMDQVLTLANGLR